MSKIKPIAELRNTIEISEVCHSELEPVFITKNGYADMVVMDAETYEQLIDVAIDDSENDSGKKMVNARETLNLLKKKYFR